MSVCQNLSPPPPSRHRSSSITHRPVFTISALGRRRSSSSLRPPSLDAPPSTTTQSSVLDIGVSQPESDPPMLFLVASRFLEWLHVHPQQHSTWSTPSSPRSSADEFVLPLSASAAQTCFGDQIHSEKPARTTLQGWLQTFLTTHASIVLVVLLFPLSTALVVFCLYTLPISLAWPRTTSDVAQLGRELHGYTQSGRGPVAHVVGVMAITAVWKHAWSIPGSVIWNVLAGALFSPAYATILLTTLTMIGSACATMLSTPLAPFLTHFFPRALDMTRNALEGDSDAGRAKSSAWVRLSVLRLIGVVPWSGINIACGVCGVSIADCMLGAFIGSLPWTAVTCQIGDILQTVASTPSPTPQTISSLLASPDIIVKLIFLSFLSLAPILGRDRLRTLIHSSASHRNTAEDTPNLKWAWIHQWRSKLRSQSNASAERRGQSVQQLTTLVNEKRAMEDLPS